MKVLWTPAPGPQTAFLASSAREILYGGAAGGGKTDALIAKMLQRVHHPKHRGIILRRTRPQLQEVIDRQTELYTAIAPGIVWNEKLSRWVWPSGAITQLGFAENEKDIRAFKSFEYDVIAFDELTSFTEKQYLFMFSRNRTKSAELAPQMLAATNPGDIGHAWVDARFVRNRVPFRVYDEYQTLDEKTRINVRRQFIPAKVWDNVYLPSRDEYVGGLLAMGEEGQMLLHGIWSNLGGAMFKRPLTEIPPSLRDKNHFVVRAMDYGLADPTAIYWLVVYPGQNRSVDIAYELYLTDTSLDGIASNIRMAERALKSQGVAMPIYSVIDPKATTRESDKQSIATKLDALGIHFEPANNDRVVGWAEVSRRLYGNGSLYVWQDRAPNLMRTLNSLQRDPKKPSDILQHQDDHAADALRYGLVEIWDQREQDTPKETLVETNRDTTFDKIVQDMAAAGSGDFIPGLGYYHS